MAGTVIAAREDIHPALARLDDYENPMTLRIEHDDAAHGLAGLHRRKALVDF